MRVAQQRRQQYKAGACGQLPARMPQQLVPPLRRRAGQERTASMAILAACLTKERAVGAEAWMVGMLIRCEDRGLARVWRRATTCLICSSARSSWMLTWRQAGAAMARGKAGGKVRVWRQDWGKARV